MSVFTNWTPVASSYDQTRRPHSADLSLGLAYTHTGKTAQQLHLLDAGCGTGNHVEYLLERGLARATLLDANDAMLEQAEEKLKNYQTDDRVKIVKHTLPTLPFEDETFDMVMSNAVFHHLTELTDENFTVAQKAIQESYRVLKPNGIMTISLSTPYQCLYGYWFTSLVTDTLRTYLMRVPEPENFKAMFETAGFAKNGRAVDVDELVFSPEFYFRADGPLHDDWWKATSFTLSAGPEEREKAKETILELKNSGQLEEYFEEADRQRANIGQISVYYAIKQ